MATRARFADRLLPVATIAVAVVVCAVVAAAAPARQSRRSRTLADLVEQVRGGDGVAALAEFVKWDAKRVEAEYLVWDSFRASGGARVSADAEIHRTAALVMLHTGAAVQLDTFGITGRRKARDAPRHYPAALRLVKTLAERARTGAVGLAPADQEALRTFCRNWFVLAVAEWLSASQCMKAADTAHEAVRILGDDAQLLLAAGSVAEVQMGPFRDRTEIDPACAEQPPSASAQVWANSSYARHGPGLIQIRYRFDAHRWLQRAVELDPALVEARLRLGRVLYWMERSKDAERELTQTIAAVKGNNASFVGYLAGLFLGQVREEADRADEARRAYEQAIAFNPHGHVARLALGHLLVVSGQGQEGWARVHEAFDASREAADDEKDPWLIYRFGQSWRSVPLVREMEGWVRQ